MSSQGWAKAPEARSEENKDASQRQAHAEPASTWHVWKQVVIGEILNVLERRRYDHNNPR
jgi:hypothetical protein